MADAMEAPSSYVSFSGHDETKKSPAIDKKPWQGDTKTCSICQSKFGDVMNRRHHCRMCGKCVCHDCSPNLIQVKGQPDRVCNPCVLNGAGALELLPALHHLRQELCSFDSQILQDFSSLPPAKHPAQAVAECVAAVDPLRRKIASMDERDSMQRRNSCPEMGTETTSSVAAEVEVAQRERRSRALADTCKSTVDARMLLSKELAQERKQRQEMEAKLAEMAEGMCQLDRMLKNLKSPSESKDSSPESKSGERDADDAGDFEPAESKLQPLKQMERALASCTLSAGIWLRQGRRSASVCSSGSSGRPDVPVLSRVLAGSTASTTTPVSSKSASSESESSGSSDEGSIPPDSRWNPAELGTSAANDDA